ncbi:flagellar hook-length control protein FliK [Oceanobacillus locisalsi]|uniref:Flagellar hook-length control protein FliK n=1 Tax=Oceanobacillus locisalsi TaxID=546107 RepID=A0ABW3NLH0_9BACI
MQTERLNLAGVLSSDQVVGQSAAKQRSNFSALLFGQTASTSTEKAIDAFALQKERQHPSDKSANGKLEEWLPEEVLTILEDNEALQEEIVELIMQNPLALQEKEDSKGDDVQQTFRIENLLNQHVSALHQAEITDESKADEQTAKAIYNEIVDLLQGIEKQADIADTAALLTKSVQNWEHFFQEHPELDKSKVLQDIHQHMQKADASEVNQVTYQMAFDLLAADLPETEINKDTIHFQTQDADKVLQDVMQTVKNADFRADGEMKSQLANILSDFGIADDKQLYAILNSTGQIDAPSAGNGQQEKVERFIEVIIQQLQRAEPNVEEQVIKQLRQQLQEWNVSAGNSVPPAETANAQLDAEGIQRIEARIAGWLQSVFKEVAPGVMKQRHAVLVTDSAPQETSHRQTDNIEADTVQRIAPTKLAAWLQTAVQDASPAVWKQDNLPLSKMEQFIVHMGQNDSSSSLSGKALLEKIEAIVQSQRLQNFARGQNPITIQLRPENLGDIAIRFAQSNGELTVQMLVSSKAVKEVLESNLHQLRNIFSPHQVSVEKQDYLAASQTEAQKTSKENQQEQQREENQETSSDVNEENLSSEAESFESFMEKLLSQNIEEHM